MISRVTPAVFRLIISIVTICILQLSFPYITRGSYEMRYPHQTQHAGNAGNGADFEAALPKIERMLSQQNTESPSITLDATDPSIDITPSSNKIRVEPAVINPFHIATLGSEVGGIIEKICCEPGDNVQSGQVVAEISKRRYDLNARKAKEKIDYFTIALHRADQDKAIKSKLVNMDAASLMDLSRAEAEAEIVEHRVAEAKFEYEQALHDLESAKVKAPFSGVVVARLKEPFEVAPPLEKLIVIADVSKVYAVANIPATMSPHFEKGAAAVFKTASGASYSGTVDRIEPSIDPKTETRKLYVLIDNPDGKLQIGMVGALVAE